MATAKQLFTAKAQRAQRLQQQFNSSFAVLGALVPWWFKNSSSTLHLTTKMPSYEKQATVVFLRAFVSSWFNWGFRMTASNHQGTKKCKRLERILKEFGFGDYCRLGVKV